MEYIFENYRIRKCDKINWICEEKVAVDPNHRLTKKKAVVVKKSKHKWELVGYYDTLSAVKRDLGEKLARDTKDYKELEKVIKLLNTI